MGTGDSAQVLKLVWVLLSTHWAISSVPSIFKDVIQLTISFFWHTHFGLKISLSLFIPIYLLFVEFYFALRFVYSSPHIYVCCVYNFLTTPLFFLYQKSNTIVSTTLSFLKYVYPANSFSCCLTPFECGPPSLQFIMEPSWGLAWG